MFTTEFAANDHTEFLLVANQSLGFDEAYTLSIDFVRSRIAFGWKNVPDPNAKFVVHYGLRGLWFLMT